jgi:hypothetical protein
MMSGFKDLKVWQRSKELAVIIYKHTQKDPFTIIEKMLGSLIKARS